MSRRVVVTGMGVASPVGHDPETLLASLRAAATGIGTQPQWDDHAGLLTRVAGQITDLALDYPRKKIRTMGRVGLLALHATEQAVAQAGLDPEFLKSGEVGVSYGSTHGSSSSMARSMRRWFDEGSFEGMPSSAYLKFMTHTAAANLGIYYGIRGRIQTTCSACTSGSQGIGYGYEAIRNGTQEVMLCGGAEELHEIHAGIFDVMFATSTRYNERPEATPRPYDAERDGLVVGEGAGTLVLESYDRAKARGATMLAEVVGYGTNCDGVHATHPSVDGMAAVIEQGLRSAGIGADALDYVNGHGTATEHGDVAETEATARVVGDGVPFSSTKGMMGHTLGACGAIESVICLLAMEHGLVPATRNLTQVDPRCAGVAHVLEPRAGQLDTVMNNNFAFGGINTSLVFRRV